MKETAFPFDARSFFLLAGAATVCLAVGYAATWSYAACLRQETSCAPAAGWLAGFVVFAPIALSFLTNRLRGQLPPPAASRRLVWPRSNRNLAVGFSQSLTEGDDLDRALAFTSRTRGESRVLVQDGRRR